MTTLQERMREELVHRNFSASAFRTYLQAVEAFQKWADKPLEELGPDELRRYHGHLLEERKLAKTTVVTHISALRFLYVRVLKHRDTGVASCAGQSRRYLQETCARLMALHG